MSLEATDLTGTLQTIQPRMRRNWDCGRAAG